jgi:hypothetical protein
MEARMAAADNIPIPYLRECLSYDAETGVLRWRYRPLSHFPSEQAQRRWNTIWALTEAGHVKASRHRYISITIDGTRYRIYAPRAAWAIKTGEYPPNEVAHDDLDPDNNRTSNLSSYVIEKRRPR